MHMNVEWNKRFFILMSQFELNPTASNSRCYCCTQTCKFGFPGASYTQSRTLTALGSPLSWTSEAATVWAETCNQHYLQGWARRSLLGTQKMAVAPDCSFGSGSKSDCLFSAGACKKPWPSILPVARAKSCAGLPGGCSKPGFAGDSGCQGRLHPPGPRGAGRLPPRVKGACGPSPANVSASLEK